MASFRQAGRWTTPELNEYVDIGRHLNAAGQACEHTDALALATSDVVLDGLSDPALLTRIAHRAVVDLQTRQTPIRSDG